MSLITLIRNGKLRATRRRLEKESKAVAAKAKRDNDQAIFEEWYNVNSWEFASIDAEIKHNDSRDLLDQAEALYLPTPGPTDRDKWIPKEDLNTFENWAVLTPESMTELRSSIRKEKRERREAVESWAKILGTIMTIFTGLVGAIIGLVAVLKK